MKVLRYIFTYLIVTLLFLLGLVLTFIESLILFSGDLLLMNEPIKEIFVYIFRFLYLTSILGMCVYVIIINLKKMKMTFYSLILVGAITLPSFSFFFLYQWYLALSMMVLLLGLLVITLIEAFNAKKEAIK